MTRGCNCENTACEHAAGGCTKSALGAFRVEYLGAVCHGCFWKYPIEHRRPIGRPTDDTCKACNGVGTDGGHRCTSYECCGPCRECDGTGRAA